MRREFLYSAGAFALGVSFGMFALGDGGGEPASEPVVASAPGAGPPKAPERVGPEGPVLALQDPAGAAGVEEAPPPQGDGIVSVALGPAGVERQIETLTARWASLEEQFNRLQQRVGTLEREVGGLHAEAAREAGDAAGEESAGLSTDTPEDRRYALVAAGVPPAAAEEIVWQQAEHDMERLELRDRAIREGWFRTERYYEELRGLDGTAVDLRGAIGDATYDRYLFSTGESNRVRVGSVIPGSPAERAGLLPGDVIESYGDARVFDFRDLRNATTQGERDEEVALQVRRGEVLVETWVPRGPLGVSLDTERVSPDG